MVLKVFFLLATLALVSLPTCSATVQQQQQQQQQAEQQCVSQADFDRVVAQMAAQTAAIENLVTKIAAIENSHTRWRNATLHILKRYLPDNPAILLENIPDKLENIQSKMEQQQNKTNRLLDELTTFRNTTMNGTEELQKKLENVTEGLHGQLQSCNGTDISIQYLPTSCREIAELNPHSPPGYYKISTTSGAVYCTMITPDNPASSCQDIATHHPLASSGYYWVNSSNGTAVQVYCDMERHCCGSTGGWMRAAYLNMTDPTHHCPTGFRLTSHSKRSCERIIRPGCTGLTFAVQSVKYSKVCGKVIGYQYATPDAFAAYYFNQTRTVDGNYVDGVSITHGHPRKHIWTFAAAVDELQFSANACPCTKTDTTYLGAVPPFLGNDYFCDTGSRNHYQGRFYPDDPLWDGRGCGPTSSCCSFNSPPWFCKELPQPTTDDIEVRVCSDEVAINEDITIEQILLYLQ